MLQALYKNYKSHHTKELHGNGDNGNTTVMGTTIYFKWRQTSR